MMTNRRYFLAGAVAAGLTTIMLPGKVIANFAIPKISVLERDDYSVRLGEWFYMYD